MAKLFLAATAALALMTSPALASNIVDETFTGTVGNLNDQAGLFGSVTQSTPYTLTYVVNLANGTYDGGGGGFAQETYLNGGSAPSQDFYSTGPGITPVDAILNINGQSLFLSGTETGLLFQYNQTYTKYTGPDPDNGSSHEQWEAIGANDMVNTVLDSNSYQTFFDQVGTLQSIDLQSTSDVNITGYQTFSFTGYDLATGQDITVSGNLDPTFYNATVGVAPAGAAPEPATWALTFAGVAMAGFCLRYRRHGLQIT